jgi:hypothetical protein
MLLILTLLLIMALPVAAHEGRHIGEFEIVFGWQNEPAYAGQMNGPELSVTVSAGHDHAQAETLEITGETGIPELTLNVSEADEGGLLVEYSVTNFTFSTQNANAEHVEGEGHAHIMVDGVEAAMVFGDPVRLPDIAPGKHEIAVQLIANNHINLTHDGEPLRVSVMVMVEGDEHEADGDHGHDEGEAHEHEDAEAEGHEHGDEGAAAEEHSHGEEMAPVIEADLHVEVTFGPETITLQLQPDSGASGRYIATLIPTLPGDYTFRVFGTINDVEVDETFSSADGQFASVEPAGDILFPGQPSAADLLARIEALEAELTAIKGE